MNKKELSEQEIRSRYISPAILDAGWDLNQIREEFPIDDGRMHVGPKGNSFRGKRRFADYLLFYKTIPLAVIEAKNNKHSVGAGMQQAQDYADMMDVPFAFSSNGDGFLVHNNIETSGPVTYELPLDQFPSPDELWQRYTQSEQFSDDQLDTILQSYYHRPGDKEPRYYQRIAINRAIKAVAQGQKRMLLVMATGTGKTFTAFQIIWRLWKAGKAERILFLADRNILVDQTKNDDFSPFGDAMTKIQKRQIDKSFEIYLALYQGVSGSDEEDNVYRQFSPDFFDLIVIDECHRGSAAADSAWREILNYFDEAVHLGLTATPKETETVSNIDYFGEPLYTYSLRQGIADGFLAPYKVMRVNLDIDMDSWRPESGQTDRYGNVIEDREYNVSDFDRSLVIDERTELVAQRIVEYMTATDLEQKTIVFCVDIDHAERMRQALINALDGPTDGEVRRNHRYVMRITGDNAEGKAQLDNFIALEETYPVIATTSKLMTTGVNAPTCKLIVLDSIINSMTEFKQIIGRGTRLRPDLGKTHFTIIDFRNATRLFQDSEFDADPFQLDEYDGDAPLTPRELTGNDVQNGDDGAIIEEPRKFYVDGEEVKILAERVQYYDASGQLTTQSFVEFSGENLRRAYQSLDQFLTQWNEADRKEVILAELTEQGVMLDEITQQIGADVDPFDAICYVAFGQPPLTRKERARKIPRETIFSQYGDTARRVLDALLDRYAESGIESLENAAEPAQLATVLKLDPFHKIGSPVQIMRDFGGPEKFVAAVKELKEEIYKAA